MGASKIDICNTALAMLGDGSIRSFTEDNIRSRLCDRLYDVSVAFVLSLFDWPFARGFVLLQQLDLDDDAVPDGYYAYQVPADCNTPIDMYPRGTNVVWSLEGSMLLVKQDSPVYLYYTVKETNSQKFSDRFVNVVAEHLASRLASPLKKDKAMAKEMYNLFRTSLQEAMAIEANIGSEYRFADEDPNYDTFVNPADSDFNRASYAELLRRGLI